MDPLGLQKQLRDNNSDLMSFCADLKQWGEEMNRKDASLKEESTNTSSDEKLAKNKVRKQTEDISLKKSIQNKANKRIKGSDYSAWEKYDVDAECSKIDDREKEISEDDDSGELTDECDETLREEAVYHKEKNKVEAQCSSSAICNPHQNFKRSPVRKKVISRHNGCRARARPLRSSTSKKFKELIHREMNIRRLELKYLEEQIKWKKKEYILQLKLLELETNE